MKYALRDFVYRCGAKFSWLRHAQLFYYRAACRLTSAALSRIPEVAAIYVGGSFARGELEPGYSDIDFVVFTDPPNSAEPAEELTERIARRYRRWRYFFPVLEKELPVYTVAEAALYRPYLMPLLTEGAARLLFRRPTLPASVLSDADDPALAALTRASDLWTKQLRAWNPAQPKLFCAHLHRTLARRHSERSTIDAVAKICPAEVGTLPGAGDRFPAIAWRVRPEIYAPFIQLPNIGAISIFPAVDFLEDAPLEHSLSDRYQVVLYPSAPGGADRLYRAWRETPPPPGAAVYYAERDLYFPLRETHFARIKSRATAGWFSALADAARMAIPPEIPGGRAAYEFTLAAGQFAPTPPRIREINRQFLRRFARRRAVFGLPEVEVPIASAKVSLVTKSESGTAALTAADFGALTEIGARASARTADYFALQSQLNPKMVRTPKTASVVVITRNRRASCARTLHSIAGMTTVPYELVVVDNASTDGTKSMIENFRPPFTVKYVYEPKVGIPHARNAGVRHATGEIIAFCDDDCEVAPDWLENLSLPFQYDDAVGCVGGKVVHENRDGLVNRFYESLYRGLEARERG